MFLTILLVQFYYAKKTKLNQQNKTVELLKLDDLNES
jgi:hypothetical protein